MSSAIIQLLVLAGIAVFLILRLRSVLGTREGFEKPPEAATVPRQRSGPNLEVIEGGPDRDITDHVDDGTDAAKALTSMKLIDPDFSVTEFLGGARGAYEMILMAFERGDVDSIEPFLGDEVHQTFVDVIGTREDQGLTIDANFVGIRAAGEIIEGNPNEIKRQKDVWTFSRFMAADNPNWKLVATGE